MCQNSGDPVSFAAACCCFTAACRVFFACRARVVLDLHPSSRHSTPWKLLCCGRRRRIQSLNLLFKKSGQGGTKFPSKVNHLCDETVVYIIAQLKNEDAIARISERKLKKRFDLPSPAHENDSRYAFLLLVRERLRFADRLLCCEAEISCPQF